MRAWKKLTAVVTLTAAALAASAAMAATAFAEFPAPTTQFTRTYMKYDEQTFARAARAADGSTYVVGQCLSSRGDYDLLLVKLRADGSVAWDRTFDTAAHGTESSSAVVVSPAGFVAVAGNSSVDFKTRGLTLAWSPRGKLLWSRTYKPADGGPSWVLDLVSDRAGRVFVAGEVSNGARERDFMVAAYAQNGTRLWTRLLDGGANGNDAAVALAADRRGDLYVGGQMERGTTASDVALAKYTSSGRRLWLRTWDDGAGGSQHVKDLAVRGAIVAMTGYSSDAAGLHGLVGRYDTSGGRRWVWVDPSVGRRTQYVSVAVDGYGHLVVAGEEDFLSGRGWDFLVTRFEPSGGPPVWDYRMSGPGSSWDFASAVAVSAEGQIFVAGSVVNEDLTADAVVVRLDPLMTVGWVARYSAGAREYFSGLALDGRGVTAVGAVSSFGLVQRFDLEAPAP